MIISLSTRTHAFSSCTTCDQSTHNYVQRRRLQDRPRVYNDMQDQKQKQNNPWQRQCFQLPQQYRNRHSHYRQFPLVIRLLLLLLLAFLCFMLLAHYPSTSSAAKKFSAAPIPPPKTLSSSVCTTVTTVQTGNVNDQSICHRNIMQWIDVVVLLLLLMVLMPLGTIFRTTCESVSD